MGHIVPSHANEDPQQKQTSKNEIQVDDIEFIIHPIFALDTSNSFFIHRWANQLHINTTSSTINRKLSFAKGDTVTPEQLAEAQRLLRNQSFLREAKIRVSSDELKKPQKVIVETWDNWSLLPTLSFSRTGGESRSSIGIKEDNLLGLGVQSKIRYESNQDRNGFEVSFDIPVNWVPYGELGTGFSENSDGRQKHLQFSKPFYTLRGRDSYFIELEQDERNDTLQLHGEDVGGFHHKHALIELDYGWLVSDKNDRIQRLSLGITRDRNSFQSWLKFPDTELPKKRDFLYPWIAWEYIEDRYVSKRNVRLINTSEDFNLGWQHYAKFGIELKDTVDNIPGYHISWISERGFVDKDSLLLFQFSANTILNTCQKDYFNLNVEAQLFHSLGDKWGYHNHTGYTFSHNNFLDQPLTLGDNSGVRGYPNNYQQGDQQWRFSNEIRYYPNINLYQFAELGWAMFLDIGQGFDSDKIETGFAKPIASVGFGARLYSTHSSSGNVAHFDITFPFTQDEGVNQWEWRFQVKRQF